MRPIPSVIAIALLISSSLLAANAQTIAPDLEKLPAGKGWSGATDAAIAVSKDGEVAIEFNKPGQQVVWLQGFEFAEGTIEFEAKGKSDPPQSSFIGVAFRVADAENFDLVYFRPFNFRASDPIRKSHAVQYVSEPKWTWNVLRKEKPGDFEKPVVPAPDGDDWFHAKVVIENKQVRVYVNSATSPSLTVRELSDRTAGAVGFFCNGYGQIKNLRITKKSSPKK